MIWQQVNNAHGSLLLSENIVIAHFVQEETKTHGPVKQKKNKKSILKPFAVNSPYVQNQMLVSLVSNLF